MNGFDFRPQLVMLLNVSFGLGSVCSSESDLGGFGPNPGFHP